MGAAGGGTTPGAPACWAGTDGGETSVVFAGCPFGAPESGAVCCGAGELRVKIDRDFLGL